MASVCQKHVKVILNQFTAPHVKPTHVEVPCQYCGEKAVYTFYYSHAVPSIRPLHQPKNHVSAS